MAVLGVGALVLWPLLLDRGKTTEVPVDEAVRRFQESTSSSSVPDSPTTDVSTTSQAPTTTELPAVPAPQLPAPGVYVYETTGRDAIDILTGDHHDYPAITTITVIPHGCGVQLRWDVAVERWVEWVECATEDGIALVERANHAVFFGMGETQHWQCTGEARPVAADASGSFTVECARTELEHVDVFRDTILGVVPYDVGGTPVEALHVRTTIDNSNEHDYQVVESWYQVGTGLLLGRTAENATSNDTAFGKVNYEETFELRLTSLDPIT